MNFARKYLNEIVSIFTLIVIILTLSNLVKYDYITLASLSQNKEAIDASSSIITSFILIIGSIASYYRFFRGRTLSSRAEIHLGISIHESEKNQLLHVLTIELENLGAFPLWEPKVNVYICKHKNTEQILFEDVDILDMQILPKGKAENTIPVVFSGEKSQYAALNKVNKSIKVVTYLVKVDVGKKVFSKIISATNTPSKG